MPLVSLKLCKICFIRGILTKMFRFDGTTFKNEASSEYPHMYVLDLGSYKGSPFVTGSMDPPYGVKTEILDYDAGQWKSAADYPFSDQNRYWILTVSE